MATSSAIENITVGEIKRFVPNDQGGWYLVIANGRFRADAKQFSEPPAIGSIVSFVPSDNPVKSGTPRRIRQIIF
jgi:hypothetical protein